MGHQKSATYLATRKGICVLPLLVELYLISIDSLSEDILNESQIAIKAEIFADREAFVDLRRQKYIEFRDAVQAKIDESEMASLK